MLPEGGYRTDIPGLTVRRTSRGFCVFKLEHTVRPDQRGEGWLEAAGKLYVNQSLFRREILLDWTSAEGEAFYPEVSENPKRYILPLPHLLGGAPLIRGWDFGYRHPACVWLQALPGRVWFIREILGTGMDTHSFRDLVRYLTGEIHLDDLQRWPKAMSWVMAARENDRMPEVPFFDLGDHPMQVVDFAGPEALQRSSAVAGESADRTSMEILASVGINLGVFLTRVANREEVFRRLLNIQPDGFPGLFFDPACRILIQGFAGGIVYEAATKEHPSPSRPRKDDFFSHLHEAAGYAVVNVVPAAEPLEPEAPRGEWINRRWIPTSSAAGFPIKEDNGGPEEW